MAFFLLCVYLWIVLIRPQDFIESMAQQPIVLYTLIITIIPFFFSKKNQNSPQLFLVIFLLIIICISAILNGWVGSIAKWVPEFSSSVIMPFMLFSKLINTSKRHKTIMFISILSALVMVHNGITQKLSESGIGWTGSKLIQNRITYLGTLADPNDLGMFFVMMVPVALYFLINSKSLIKVIWFIAVITLLYGVYLTNSRGALLGVFSLLGFWMLNKYGISKTFLVGLFFSPIVFIVASKFRTIDAEEESAAGRVEAWYEDFQMLIHNPLFGVGMNGFTEHHYLTAHNSYVLIAAELGFFGFITWTAFLMLTGLMLYQVAFYHSSLFKQKVATPIENETLSPEVQEEIALAKVSFFSLVGYLVTAFFLSRSYALVLYIYAGLGVSGYYRMLSLIPTFSSLTLGRLFPKMIAISAAAIIFLYIVVRVLL